MTYKLIILFVLIAVMLTIMFRTNAATDGFEASAEAVKKLEAEQEKQMQPAPTNVVPPAEDIMDTTTDVPPNSPLQESPGNATARAAVLNPNSIALPEQANVYWKIKEAQDLNKCKINRNGNGGIYHVKCVNRDTGAPSELCKDLPFNEITMSEPPLRGPGGNRSLMEVYYKKGRCDGRWDVRNIIDKGCLPGKIGRSVEIQCRLPSQNGELGLGVHGCPNMKRQPINGQAMLSDPVQTVNRDSSWSSAILDDQACRPAWNVSKKVDKGCQAQSAGRVFHIPCTISNGSLSVGCKKMERQSIDGQEMLLNPVRNPDQNNAYTKVVVDDKSCSMNWNFGALKKLQCRKDKPGMVYQAACVRADGSKSLGCQDISPQIEINGKKQLVPASRSVEDAALSRIVLDEESCAPRWNWTKREKGSCVKGGFRSWTIPCTDGKGRLSAGCLDAINTNAFVDRIKQDGLEFVNAKRRDFKTMDVFTKDKLCEPKWQMNEKKVGIDCKYGGRPYTVPCRNFEGKFSNKCADMKQTAGMVNPPKRLNPYRSEIYLKNKQCEVETKFLVANSSVMRRDPRWVVPKQVRKDYRDLRLKQFKEVMSNRST